LFVTTISFQNCNALFKVADNTLLYLIISIGAAVKAGGVVLMFLVLFSEENNFSANAHELMLRMTPCVTQPADRADTADRTVCEGAGG
jgi:hypothetical protein